MASERFDFSSFKIPNVPAYDPAGFVRNGEPEVVELTGFLRVPGKPAECDAVAVGDDFIGPAVRMVLVPADGPEVTARIRFVGDGAERMHYELSRL